jgi:hypothetical protein
MRPENKALLLGVVALAVVFLFVQTKKKGPGGNDGTNGDGALIGGIEYVEECNC